MAEKASSDDIKELKTSDLDERDLQKAIEKSIASSPKKSRPKTAEVKKVSEPEQDKETEKEDSGEKVAVIVKKRGYVSDKFTAPTKKSVEPTKKVEEDVIKPPSEMNKVVKVPDKIDEPSESDSVSDKVEVTVESSKSTEKAKKSDPAEPVEAPADKDKPKEEPNKDESTKPKEEFELEPEPEPKKETAASEEPKKPETLAPPPTPPKTPAEAELLDQTADKAKSAKQKPTVFDTDQYHLPIKPRNKKYVSSSISWTLLALVFIGVGGYVMYRLGVIDIEDYKFW